MGSYRSDKNRIKMKDEELNVEIVPHSCFCNCYSSKTDKLFQPWYCWKKNFSFGEGLCVSEHNSLFQGPLEIAPSQQRPPDLNQ